MFYYIKNGKIFASSAQKIDISHDQMIESDINDGIFENWKIMKRPKKKKEISQKDIKLFNDLWFDIVEIDWEFTAKKNDRYFEKQLEKGQQYIKKQLEDYIKSFIKKYPMWEVALWPFFTEDAQKFIDGTWNGEIIEQLLLDWEDKKEFCLSVIAKSNNYTQVLFEKIKERRKIEKSIKDWLNWVNLVE